MDNDQLIDRIQNLLLGTEERNNQRFEPLESKMGDNHRLLDGKLESVRAEVRLHNELWRHS